MHQCLATFTYGGNRYLCIKFTLICQRRKTLCLQWSYASVKLETLRWFCTNLLRSKHIHASWLQIWDKVTYLLYIELIFAYMAKTVVSHRIWHITYILFKKKKNPLIIIAKNVEISLLTKQFPQLKNIITHSGKLSNHVS